MKKKMIGLTASLLLITGCGKIPKLSNGDDAVVSFKNGDMISVNDLYENIKDTYGLYTLITMIDTYTLEKTFPDYIDTAKESAKSYMNVLKGNYDSDDDLLNDIKSYTGMNSIKAYEEYIYISYMQSHATEEYAKMQVTDKEISNYYKNELKGDIEVSHILITPQVTDDMSDEEKTAKEKEAKEKAESLLKTLKDTPNEKLADEFSKLAKENSEDESTKENGGALGKINQTSLSSDYDELIKAAYSLKDNELYKNVVTTQLGYHIILKTKSYDKASLDDAKDNIKTILAQEKMSKDNTISYNSLQYYRKELGMEIQDTEMQTQYGYYMNNLLTSLDKND